MEHGKINNQFSQEEAHVGKLFHEIKDVCRRSKLFLVSLSISLIIGSLISVDRYDRWLSLKQHHFHAYIHECQQITNAGSYNTHSYNCLMVFASLSFMIGLLALIIYLSKNDTERMLMIIETILITLSSAVYDNYVQDLGLLSGKASVWFTILSILITFLFTWLGYKLLKLLVKELVAWID